ncbi:nitronate monooxygenase [Paenibacillus sp. BSR1-1]|uniref:NAD(P)H-dependent flavin oxidoreductase n=1 Tax=Paenibacillus sp. BSR1-1 TaxID=3020845 RepID=UPI0025AF6F92|nr:nitronate monooxygenase [Paenibacillus sp. BSR1-1]MDN3016012.1 nitronate monooxygenase [Paenibacillus sp. BSR1-1]
MWENNFTRLLKVKYPIIQAPMAGGITSSELVAAVSNSGALGMIGAGYMSPEQVRLQIKEVQQLTDKPFGVNVFVPAKYEADEERLHIAKTLLQPILEELGVEDKVTLPSFEEDLQSFHEQLKVILDENVPICSFTFGIPPLEMVNKLKENGVVLIGTATTVSEALINEKAGMDAVVVQGTEAGGHRGTFHIENKHSLIGLMSLIPQVADQISIPVIAAGGIMDGRGLIAAKSLGALGVQMGSAFLVCEESSANPIHKEAIIQATEEQIVVTKAFSGKMARGVSNRFIEKMSSFEDELPDYPIQNELTKAIRKNSSAKGNPENMSLWAGQSPRLARKLCASDLINQIVNEAEIVRSKL